MEVTWQDTSHQQQDMKGQAKRVIQKYETKINVY
uniref:Uncharacterized protein n=1 Tax=Anguilla anguilla TaxID=7936 RepID=A0A0E9V5J5_ANGAN